MTDLYSEIKVVGRAVGIYPSGKSKVLRLMYNDNLDKKHFVSVVIFGSLLEEFNKNNVSENDIIEVSGELTSYTKVYQDQKYTNYNIIVRSFKVHK